MNDKNQQKLTNFLDEKIRKIVDETRNENPKLNLTYIKTAKGFENSIIRNRNWGDGYMFVNRSGYQCYLYFKGKWTGRTISITIDNISSSGCPGTIGTLFRCMDEIDVIAKEVQQLKNELEKQEKINIMAKNSINTWLKSVIQNQPYSFYTTEDENKITLSIKIKNGTQLDIPIYYKRFQKIMPILMETIQQFEETVNKSTVKVLICNSKPNQQWITQSSIKN